MEVKVNFQVAKILCYITKHLKFCCIYYFCKRILYKIIYVLKISYKNIYPCKIRKVGKHISIKFLEDKVEKVMKQRQAYQIFIKQEEMWKRVKDT